MGKSFPMDCFKALLTAACCVRFLSLTAADLAAFNIGVSGYIVCNAHQARKGFKSKT